MSVHEDGTVPGRTGATAVVDGPAPDSTPARSRAGESVRGALSTLGEMAGFSGKILKSLPHVRRYATEVIHQAGILILTSGLIIWVMEFVIGTMCGTEASYTLRNIGAPLYSGIYDAWCGLRELAPYMWGYIFAAKVGCGLVAEIGSMRISDEIDAMEVMGVRSIPYLLGSRVLATWLAIPFLFTVGLGTMYVAEYLTTVTSLGVVSSGGFLYIFWLYQNPLDLLYAELKTIAMGTAIVFVSCYYGFNARGGPVGVGRNTAKSMMVNMVLIHVIGVLGTQLFWGLNANAPVAN